MSDSKVTVGIVLKAAVGAAGKAFSAFGGVATKAFKVVAGAAIAAAGALAGMIAKTVSLADALMNASERTGASAEFLSAIGYHAKLAGSSLGTLEKSLQNLAKGAVGGSKSFSKWGVEVKTVEGGIKTSQQLFASAAERISQLKSKTAQMAAAQDLFGKAGKELLPIVSQGAAGLEEMSRAAGEAGITISSLSVRLGDELGDQMTKSAEQTNGLFAQISTFLMPILIVLIRRFNETGGAIRKWIETNKQLIDANLIGFLTWIADSGLPAIATGADLVAKVWLGWKLLFQTLEYAASKFTQVVLEGFATVAGGASELASFFGADGLAAGLSELAVAQSTSARGFERDADIASAAMAGTANQIANTESAIGNFAVTASAGLRTAIDDAKALTAEFAKMGATGSGGAGAGGLGELPAGKPEKYKGPIYGPTPAQIKEAIKARDSLTKIGPVTRTGEADAAIAKINARDRAKALQNERTKVQELTRSYQDLGANMGEALGVAFASVVTGSDKSGEAFKSMAKQMGIAILNVAETQILAAAASGGAQAGNSASSLPWPANMIIAPIAAAAMFGLLRGFLGKLHTGGVVPGPEGRERMMVVQGGEEMSSIAKKRSKDQNPDRGGGRGSLRIEKLELQALSVPSRAGWERSIEDGLIKTVDKMNERGIGFGRSNRRPLAGNG